MTWVRPGHTSLALTDISLLAVRVSGALWATPSDGVRLGDQTRLTATDGVSSKINSTHSSWTTWRWITGVWLLHTPLSLAHISLLAVRVNDTLWAAASDGVRLRDQSRLTGADGVAMLVDIAPGARSTRIGLARVRLGHTPQISADHSHPAVRVNLTLWLAAGDGVWVGGEARDTSTLRVAVSVDSTQGARSTGGWVAGINRPWWPHTQMTRSSSKPVMEDHRRIWNLLHRSTSINRRPKRDEARNAGADGVTSTIDNALSGGSTWRWVTW